MKTLFSLWVLVLGVISIGPDEASRTPGTLWSTLAALGPTLLILSIAFAIALYLLVRKLRRDLRSEETQSSEN